MKIQDDTQYKQDKSDASEVFKDSYVCQIQIKTLKNSQNYKNYKNYKKYKITKITKITKNYKKLQKIYKQKSLV